MKTTILNKIINNERFAKVVSTRERLSEKYGPITVAGGCLVDCYFDKEFYDIDMFIQYKDLKPEWKKQMKKATSHIVDVLRDELDGEDIDIIVVDYSVEKHIRRFDQAFKQIWLNDKGLHIKKQAVKDLIEMNISVNTFNGPVVYFRVIKSARKYGMTVADEDLFLMENFMSILHGLRLPDKYAKMKREFLPFKNPNKALGDLIYSYSRKYWDMKCIFLPGWKLVRLVTKPYMNLIDWKHIR